MPSRPDARSLTRDAPAGGLASTRATALAVLEDLQDQGPDLGWAEANNLADALLDHLSHLLVDVAADAHAPSARPEVIGSVGGSDGALDAASCRATASSLRRAGAVLVEAAGPASAWAGGAGEVALDLADLLEHTASSSRQGQLRSHHRGPVVRRLHALHRRLTALG